MTHGMSEDEREALRRDTNFIGSLAAKWIAIAVGAGVIFSLVYALWIRPATLNAERKQNTHSTQYVEGQRTFLVQKLTACQQLETDIHTLEQNGADPTLLAGKQAQLKAFIAEMRQRAALIEDDAVPADVRSYLDTHK